MPPGPHKFDPARAHLLDSAERDRFLPDETLVELLALRGDETVVDYGAGTGRVALAAAARLPRGRVIAVDESPEMLERLRQRTADSANIEVLPAIENTIALSGASVQRILAINLLHEIRGETALAEMRRLLAPDGLLVIADWDRERPSQLGPPAPERYSAAEAEQEVARVGFHAERPELHLPYHFVLLARPAARATDPS
jgi:ubiquinone/menaquinone biosynthesis C-methylase UbiE